MECVPGFQDKRKLFHHSCFTCWNPSWLEGWWNIAGLQTWSEKRIRNFHNNNTVSFPEKSNDLGFQPTCPPVSVLTGLGDGVDVGAAGNVGGAGGGARSSGWVSCNCCWNLESDLRRMDHTCNDSSLGCSPAMWVA